MAQQNEVHADSVVANTLMEAIYQEWYTEHGEFDDMELTSDRELRDYITRAIGRSGGAELIAIERARQVVSEGYTLEHDRQHGTGQLAQAAEAYLTGTAKNYPWPIESLKLSGNTLRNLVKAGALIAAAIDVEIAHGPRVKEAAGKTWAT